MPSRRSVLILTGRSRSVPSARRLPDVMSLKSISSPFEIAEKEPFAIRFGANREAELGKACHCLLERTLRGGKTRVLRRHVRTY
jgi:hypothetical protein